MVGQAYSDKLIDHPFLHVAGIIEPMVASDEAIGEMGLPIWTDLAEPLALAEIDAVTANLEAFSAAAQGRAPYPFTPDQMVHNIEVLEAIAISSEDRRTVAIQDLRDLKKSD